MRKLTNVASFASLVLFMVNLNLVNSIHVNVGKQVVELTPGAHLSKEACVIKGKIDLKLNKKGFSSFEPMDASGESGRMTSVVGKLYCCALVNSNDYLCSPVTGEELVKKLTEDLISFSGNSYLSPNKITCIKETLKMSAEEVGRLSYLIFEKMISSMWFTGESFNHHVIKLLQAFGMVVMSSAPGDLDSNGSDKPEQYWSKVSKLNVKKVNRMMLIKQVTAISESRLNMKMDETDGISLAISSASVVLTGASSFLPFLGPMIGVAIQVIDKMSNTILTMGKRPYTYALALNKIFLEAAKGSNEDFVQSISVLMDSSHDAKLEKLLSTCADESKGLTKAKELYSSYKLIMATKVSNYDKVLDPKLDPKMFQDLLKALDVSKIGENFGKMRMDLYAGIDVGVRDENGNGVAANGKTKLNPDKPKTH